MVFREPHLIWAFSLQLHQITQQHLLDALTEADFATATQITANELIAHEITIFKDRVRIVERTMALAFPL